MARCSGPHTLPYPCVQYAVLGLLPAGEESQVNPLLSGAPGSLSFLDLLVWQSPITLLILKKWVCTDQLCAKMEVTLLLQALVSSLVENKQVTWSFSNDVTQVKHSA